MPHRQRVGRTLLSAAADVDSLVLTSRLRVARRFSVWEN